MKQILLEVDDNLADAWNRVSEDQKKRIGTLISSSLASQLLKGHDDKKGHALFLSELRNKMNELGLTQAELDSILSNGW